MIVNAGRRYRPEPMDGLMIVQMDGSIQFFFLIGLKDIMYSNVLPEYTVYSNNRSKATLINIGTIVYVEASSLSILLFLRRYHRFSQFKLFC